VDFLCCFGSCCLAFCFGLIRGFVFVVLLCWWFDSVGSGLLLVCGFCFSAGYCCLLVG